MGKRGNARKDGGGVGGKYEDQGEKWGVRGKGEMERKLLEASPKDMMSHLM